MSHDLLKEIEVNLAYRWFLGIGIYEPVPNYSTWAQNYIRRYKDSDIFDAIFTKILDQASATALTQWMSTGSIIRIQTNEPTLGDIFMQLTGSDLQ